MIYTFKIKAKKMVSRHPAEFLAGTAHFGRLRLDGVMDC